MGVLEGVVMEISLSIGRWSVCGGQDAGTVVHVIKESSNCFGTRKTIGVKEVHLITNGFDRDVKMAEEISNFYCSTTPEII